MRKVEIDRDKCIGCLTCVCACMVSHEQPDARNRVVIDSKNKPAPIFCRNCENPECTFTCMTGAMSKNTESGRVEYDEERCAGCYMCIMACPYGVLKAGTVSKREIMKCDLCRHTEEGYPQCVRRCPVGAISVEVTL